MSRQQFYQGKFKPTNLGKYRGKSAEIVYRSGWEFALMKWCDENPNIVSWSSEEVVVPYVCKTDGRKHRYFIDFAMNFKNGQVLLVELKPKKQVEPPTKKPGRKTRTYIREVLQYAKNVSKWEAAKIYAKNRDCEFQVWTEEHLQALGIPVFTSN